MKGFHLPIQHPRQLRDRLRADRLVGQQRHHSPYPARRNPSQEGLPNQLRYLGRASFQGAQAARQKRSLPRAPHSKADDSQPRHVIPFIVPIPAVHPFFIFTRSLVPLQTQIFFHLLLGVRPQQFLQRPPGSALKVSPKTLLQIPHKPLKLFRVIVSSHRGVGSFSWGILLLAQQNLHPSPFYTNKLTSPVPARPNHCAGASLCVRGVNGAASAGRVQAVARVFCGSAKCSNASKASRSISRYFSAS